MITPGFSHPPFLNVLPTRVRRNYAGGSLLESWCGGGGGGDGDQPEDWIASTTAAVNPGLPERLDEGLTRVQLPDGTTTTLAHLVQENPAYYLGNTHLANYGAELGFLAKLLDSAMRLHVQAHPTAQFSRQYLGSRYGKFESYVILGFRPGYDPTLRLGFQRAPSREEWRRIIADQDIPAMDACFDEIPLEIGEVWCVPGGMPHAIGAGVLMLEVMEPSDLVVRCEFEREGIVVPPAGRFMQRGLDFCLDIFDYQSRSVQEIKDLCRIAPRATEVPGEELLVGPAQTECFTVLRQRVEAPATLSADVLELLLVTSGRGVLRADDVETALSASSRVIVPAGQGAIQVDPLPGESLEILKIRPNPLLPSS